MLTLSIGVLAGAHPARAATAAAASISPSALGAASRSYRCDGDLLVASASNGAVDAVAIPNQSAGTVPGAFVVLRWRDLSLQLPRTNNAGPPSYSDGTWWWGLEDPDHPDLRWRHGGVQTFACETAAVD